MTADEARTTRVPLGFLPKGNYRATVWEDGKAPDEVRRSERIVTASDVLALRLSPAGGAAVVLELYQ
jgi:alpha-glucosidase